MRCSQGLGVFNTANIYSKHLSQLTSLNSPISIDLTACNLNNLSSENTCNQSTTITLHLQLYLRKYDTILNFTICTISLIYIKHDNNMVFKTIKQTCTLQQPRASISHDNHPVLWTVEQSCWNIISVTFIKCVMNVHSQPKKKQIET